MTDTSHPPTTSHSPFVHIGHSPARIDGLKKITATVPFVPAMSHPGMLHVALARSELPHARIVSVKTERARAVPRVVLVLTGADLERIPNLDPWIGPAFKDHPLLAIDKVHFVGEPLAAVVAESVEAAREAAALIEVEYEALAAVIDAREAMRPGAPLVHEHIRPSGVFPDLAHLPTRSGTNVCYHYKLRRGDVEAGFRAADLVFEDVFTTPAAQHASLEPHAWLAEVEPDGKLSIWSTTQTPSFVRVELADAFHLPLTQVRVRVPYLGGGYGGKMYDKHEPLVALLARLTGRPIKLVLSRGEEFYTTTRHAATLRLKSGVMRDGRIVARHVEIFWDTGAYADIGPRIAGKTGFAAAGPYRIEHVWIDSYCVYTNKAPAGAFRGFGTPQIVWAYERQADLIAQRLGLDPLAFRLAQTLDEGDEFATGTVLHAVGLRACLEQAAQAIGLASAESRVLSPESDRPPGRRPPAVGIASAESRVLSPESEVRTQDSGLGTQHSKRRGIGIACGLKAVIYPSTSSAIVALNADGSAMVYSSTVEMGQGSQTTLAQIAAEVLGVPLEKVAIHLPDTDVTPYDTITAGSRSTYHMGNAVRLAAEEARRQVLEAAARRLEVSPSDLELREERAFVRGAPERGIGLPELFAVAFGGRGSTVLGQGRFAPTTAPVDPETGMSAKSTEYWFPGATAVEVEVDEETGQVRVLRIAAAADVGTAIHPAHCAQQIVGATTMALSLALFEAMVFDNGQVANPSLADYLLASFEDASPAITPIVVQVPHPDGPFGAKGVGETAIFSLAPAIANAVANAVGINVVDLPITPERVLRAIKEG
ncbi:MAG: xanthine dehydrogenase family protein [Chloroflexi bacterium]|nr:xanthine dehydrogenase family protein [Chloroflexota bacterium]